MSSTLSYRAALSARVAALQEQLSDIDAELTEHASKDDDERLPSPHYVALTADGWAAVEELRRAIKWNPTSGLGVMLASPEQTYWLRPKPLPQAVVFLTPGGYRIDYWDEKWYVGIFELCKGTWINVTTIWGDPHVDENPEISQAEADGFSRQYDWHFGGSSSFILLDGTKVHARTGPKNGNRDIGVTVGIDIQSGFQRGYAGQGPDGESREPGIADDRKAWDAEYLDSELASGGVFALQHDGQWAVYNQGNGRFYDVKRESWASYVKDPDVDMDPDAEVLVRSVQRKAIDGEPDASVLQHAVDMAEAASAYALMTVGDVRAARPKVAFLLGRLEAELEGLAAGNDGSRRRAARAEKRDSEVYVERKFAHDRVIAFSKGWLVGEHAELDEGDYSSSKLAEAGASGLQSVQVAYGWSVTLFQGPDLDGESRMLGAGDHETLRVARKLPQSIRVQRSS